MLGPSLLLPLYLLIMIIPTFESIFKEKHIDPKPCPSHVFLNTEYKVEKLGKKIKESHKYKNKPKNFKQKKVHQIKLMGRGAGPKSATAQETINNQ